MIRFQRHLLLVAIALGIAVIPGLDWSYLTREDPPQKWQDATGVFFQLNNRVPQDPEDFQSALRNAARSWGGYAVWNFEDGGPTDAQYGTREGINVFDYLGFPDEPDVPGESIATPYASNPSSLYDADSSLNFITPLSTLGDPNSYDVQSVGVHEFGHWLYLDDLDTPGPVMYRYLAKGEIRRALDQDDIDGIRFLYPGGSAGPPPGSGQICHKVMGCRVCEPNQQGISMKVGTRKKEIIESVGEIQTLMFQKPQPRAILYAFVTDLPELEHIALNHEEELAQAWDPVTDDWLPGLYWLSGDPVRGRNLVLTKERAVALVHGLDVIRDHSSRHLRRDIESTRRFIRSHVGRSLEDMRAELFDEYDALKKEHSFGSR